MASRIEFVEFIVDQLRGAGEITYRKMFGLICDDQLFLKITKAGQETCPDLVEAPPYEGAKNYFLVEDVEDADTLTKLVKATYQELPEPKPKERKAK